MFFIIFYELILNLGLLAVDGPFELVYHIALDITTSVSLSWLYLQLTKLIQEYHPIRYETIKVSMKYFVLVEVVPLSLTIFYKINRLF